MFPHKQNLPNKTYRTKPAKPNLPNQTFPTKPTKPKQTYQRKPTKPNLPNQPTKPNLPNQTYLTNSNMPKQAKHSQPSLLNQTNQTKPTKRKPKSLVKAVNAWVRSAFGNVSLHTLQSKPSSSTIILMSFFCRTHCIQRSPIKGKKGDIGLLCLLSCPSLNLN